MFRNREQHDNARWRDMFYESQKQGVDEFGSLWLKVNNVVVQNVQSSFDTGSQQVRTLISVTILETLRATKTI